MVESKIVKVIGDQGIAVKQLATGEFVISVDSLTPPTTILNNQVTIVSPRVPLTGASTSCKSVTIENPSTNAVVYVGNATVDNTNGYRLYPGATVSMDIDNLNKVYVTGTVGNIVSYIAVN